MLVAKARFIRDLPVGKSHDSRAKSEYKQHSDTARALERRGGGIHRNAVLAPFTAVSAHLTDYYSNCY